MAREYFDDAPKPKTREFFDDTPKEPPSFGQRLKQAAVPE